MSDNRLQTPTEPLARLVRQKRRLLEQLVRLTDRQGDLINQGEVASLVQLLSGKQQLIAGLQVVERGLDKFRDEDPESRAWPTPEDRSACQADADACNQLLATVVAAEQDHATQMAERRDEVGARLRKVQSAHAASSAYKPHLRSERRPAAPQGGESFPAALDLTANG